MASAAMVGVLDACGGGGAETINSYPALILADSPALYWRLNEKSGTAISDSSGSGHAGSCFTKEVVGDSGLELGVRGAISGDGRALRIKGSWRGNPRHPIQVFPGTGVRADDYAPYVSGSRRTFECWLYKTQSLSFETMFSGDGNGGAPPKTPHPTFEWGTNADGTPFLRFYPNVDTYPTGWVDWGNPNSGVPKIDFELDRWFHVVCTYDDSSGIAELFLNGQSQGKLGPTGFRGRRLAYNSSSSPGNFQIGFRGNLPAPGNFEVMGGVMDEVAVYERILAGDEILEHWRVGAGVGDASLALPNFATIA